MEVLICGSISTKRKTEDLRYIFAKWGRITFKPGNSGNRKALFQSAAMSICWLVLITNTKRKKNGERSINFYITYYFASTAAVKLMNKSGGFFWLEELPWRTSSQTLPPIGWPKSPGLKWCVVQRCRLSRESWNTSLKTWVLGRRLVEVPVIFFTCFLMWGLGGLSRKQLLVVYWRVVSIFR